MASKGYCRRVIFTILESQCALKYSWNWVERYGTQHKGTLVAKTGRAEIVLWVADEVIEKARKVL